MRNDHMTAGGKQQRRKMFLRMVTASLMRRRSRMVIALLAIAIGAAILSGLMTIYYDVPRQLGAEFRNYGANLIVMPKDGSLAPDDLDRITALIEGRELVGAAPYRYETVRIHEQPLMACGTDMAQVRKTAPYWLVDGAWPSTPGDLMVGSTVAEDLNLRLGSRVEVSYQPEGADAGQVDDVLECTVTGILNTGGSEEGYVYLSMDDLDGLTGESGVIDLIELSVSTNADGLAAYLQAIDRAVPAGNARLVKRVTASETTVLSKLQALILLVTIVVLALTMISVATTMTAVVTERRKEIGLRKAIGASDREIFAEFMGEGVLLGAVGGILGGFLGFGFAQIISVSIFSSSISFRFWILPFAIVVSVGVTALASLFPIRNATTIDPALVLKGE